MLALTSNIVGEPDSRAEVFVVVLSELGIRAANRKQFEIGAALGDCASTDEIEVLVPTDAQVHGELLSDFPVVLQVKAQLLRTAGHIKVWIARAGRHTDDRTSSRKALRIKRRAALVNVV